jgi:hypothetical protein
MRFSKQTPDGDHRLELDNRLTEVLGSGVDAPPA